MDRNSLRYKFRRKLQKIAYLILPNKFLSKIYYKIVLNEKLNIDKPQTFNEKIQWLKLNYYPKKQLVIDCTDKIKVRNYVKEKGFEKYLTNMKGYWSNAEDIDWEKLPQQFVLKCNHGCAYNILCSDKDTFDKRKSSKKLNEWLKEDFGAYNIEVHYSKIKPKAILCEEFLGEKITDYKFYCFNGVPQFFYVSYDLIHDRDAKIGFFDLNGEKLPLIREDYEDIDKIDLPIFLSEMIKVSRVLSADFPFVRVDFFVTKDRFYFAELTFTPGAGMMPIKPKIYDYEWGKLLNIDLL